MVIKSWRDLVDVTDYFCYRNGANTPQVEAIARQHRGKKVRIEGGVKPISASRPTIILGSFSITASS